jgi:hypothetical protein
VEQQGQLHLRRANKKIVVNWYSKLKPLDVGAMKLKVNTKYSCFYLTQN